MNKESKTTATIAHGNSDKIIEQKPLHIRWSGLTKNIELRDDAKLTTKAKHVIQNTATDMPSSKIILSNISGEAKPGEVLALMGPSGSGKTSLMNVLSGRAAYQDGSISINGKKLGRAEMKNFMSKVAYVKQQDIFFQSLTVKQQLTYTAQLRISDTIYRKEERQKKIKSEVIKILKMLQLEKCADSKIMICSGGEKKRVNIGSELITNPAVIMLDEPTSGLDSASSSRLLDILKDLAKNHGKTIVCSVHQPNSRAFLGFDKLLMLSEGNVVYFGAPDKSLEYLGTEGYPCPPGHNLADHWMELLVTNEETAMVLSSRKNLEKAWKHDEVTTTVDIIEEIQLDNIGNGVGEKTSKYKTSWCTQFTTLLHRALTKSQVNIFSPVNFFRTVAIGFAVGLVYFNQKYTEADARNIYSYFFFTMQFWVVQGMFESIFSFPQERVVILKERAGANYRLSSYFAAMTIADVPMFLLMPFIYMTISFWMVCPAGFGFTIYLSITCIAFLSVMTGQAFGFLIGAAFDDIQVGQAVGWVIILFLMLLGGFFVDNIPIWLSFVQYLSPFSYASNATLQIMFQKPIPCDGSGALSPFCNNSSINDDATTPSLLFASPEDILDTFNVTLSLGLNVGILLLFCFIPRLFAYALLRRKKAGERE